MSGKTRGRLDLFPLSTEIRQTAAGQQLTIAGSDLAELAQRFGTPLYLYDQVSLEAAVAQAATIVVDNMLELERLGRVAQETGWPMPELWLRFRPGVTVETHAHVQTGQQASKFDMDASGIEEAVHRGRAQQLPVKGLHFHLGSQFRDPAPILEALDKTLDLAEAIGMEEGWVLCPGAGCCWMVG